MTPLIPDNAPFTPEQRAWLNGFLAGLLGGGMPSAGVAAARAEAKPLVEVASVEEDFPWRDPLMPITERMALAEDRHLPLKLFAAMGQQDCGQCGYLCQSYAEALATGQESDATLCVPGGKDTRKVLKQLLGATRSAATGPAAAAVPEPLGYNRKQPVMAKQVAARALNREGSERDTRHVVIDIAASGLAYEPGDALGVFPANDPDLVADLLAALRTDGAQKIAYAGRELELSTWLTEQRDITKPSDEFITLMLEVSRNPAERAQLAAWQDAGLPEGMDVLDMLQACPDTCLEPTALVAALGALQPRLYSIASCLDATPGEVHLTVARVRYDLNQRPRQGVASGYLAQINESGRPLAVYVQRTPHFKLPRDPATPIIMVGPGTGVAPFRGFLQARHLKPEAGPAWLFFGNPHAACDFLYEEELKSFLAHGCLTTLSTAFSRDGSEKCYVQHRMLEAATELWQWLQEGAHVYVCGDAKRMAADVDQALLQIIREQGGMSLQAAQDYIRELTRHERYQRDVY